MSNSESSTAPIVSHAQSILARIGILNNDYFLGLADGSMSREAFVLTQQQFFFAVTFFPRPMAALVGRIDDPHLRLDILHNLVEEHGDFAAESFHHNTFREFLARMGSDVANLDAANLWPEVRAFNSVLSCASVLDELEVGIACMGIIEQAFAGISARIGAAVVARNWLSSERLIHYKLHAAIDERHAEEFYRVVLKAWHDPERRYFVIQGMELGAYVFDRLYRDLSQRSRAVS